MADHSRNTFVALVPAALLAWGMAVSGAAADVVKRPQRIVSTNYCTDQILLRLVEPERIVSLTYLSWKPGETTADLQPALRHAKKNHGLAEEVLMLDPDLVVGGAFSAGFSNSLLARLGRNVIVFEPEQDFEQWYANVRRMGEAVGEPERAEKMIAEFKSELAAARAEIPPGEMPIYANLTVNNWIPGKDTLYQQLVNAGGFRTLGETLGYSGYRGIPLEQLIRTKPDLVSNTSAYESPPSLATMNLQHPLVRRWASQAYASIKIPERYVNCTTPETLKMIRQLVQARKDIEAIKQQRSATGADPGK